MFRRIERLLRGERRFGHREHAAHAIGKLFDEVIAKVLP